MKQTAVRYTLFFLVLYALWGCGGTNHHGRTHEDYDVWGLDVSRHQGNINWNRVCGSNNPPRFVFLKATEGTLIVDPAYAGHAKKLDEQKVLRGAYHFFGHRTPGGEQAQNFIKTAKLQKGNLIPVLDIEKHRFMTDPAKTVKEAKAFCRAIRKEYGTNPIIYCSTNFYEAFLKKDFKAKDYVLWIADYRGNPTNLDWSFWQYTETYHMRGIKGKVDRNVFAGTLEDLQKLILK